MKRKLLTIFLILYISLCPIFSSCKIKGNDPLNTESESSENFPYTFTDSLGKSITLDKKPKKVAVLFSSFVEIWLLSGGTVDITVGESIKRGFANEDVILVDDGSGHTTLNLEILISEMPDLVICTTDYAIQKETAEKLGALGITAAAFKIESLNDYLKVLKIFTDINGTPEIYHEHGVLIKEKTDSLLSKIESYIDEKEKTEILFIRAGSSAKSTKAKNSEDNFACKMLCELGTHNIADDASILLDGLSLEEILIRDPEYIFITSMGDEAASKAYVNDLFEKDGWNNLSAVKEKKVIFLSKDTFHYKPNQRWFEAYNFLANTLYPELNTK